MRIVGVTVVNFNIINDNIKRLLLAGGDNITGGTNRRVRIGCVLSLESFPSDPCGYFAGSFGSVLGSSRVRIIIRTVKKAIPTCRFAGGLLLTNGRIISSGGRLITGRKARLLRLTGRKGVGCLFRTDINNNVPVVEPLVSDLANGSVANVIKVLGNAAGCVLARVVGGNGSFRTTLSRTRRGNCTRGSPATSIVNCSAYQGVTVLTSLTCNGCISDAGVPARNVAGVATRSAGCTRRLNCDIGLINRYIGTRGNVCTEIYPTFVDSRDPLCGVSSIFGNVLIRNGSLKSIVFCNGNTNGLPATDTVISSLISITGRGDAGVEVL